MSGDGVWVVMECVFSTCQWWGSVLVLGLLLSDAFPARAADAGKTADAGKAVDAEEAVGATAELAVPDGAAAQASGASEQPAVKASGVEEPAAIEVKVVGTKKPRSDRSADSVVVRRTTLQRSASATTLEVLGQQAADVYVTSRGGGIHGVASGASGGVHIRGLGGSPNAQIVVVEDGVADYQAIFGHPIPDAYQSFLLDSATVVRGGDSVLYGTNAMGGAILLTSRWRNDEGWELETDSSVGSFQSLRQSVALLAKQGRYQFASGLSAYRSDGHRRGAGGSTTVGQVALRADLGEGWGAVVQNKAMHLTGADPGPASHPNDNHYFDVVRDRLATRIEWARDKVSIKLHPFLNIGRHLLYDGFYSTDVTTGAVLEGELRLHPRAVWLTGVSVDVAGAKARNRTANKRFHTPSQTTTSWYQQLTVEPFRRLFVVVGARAVMSDTYDSAFLYKAGIRYSLGNGWYLRARLARNYRQPTLHELYLPFPVANPDLQPERSRSVDGGVGYANDHVELSVSGYSTKVENLIKTFGVWPHAEIINIDQTTVPGLELSGALHSIGPLTFRASGNVQDVGRYTKQNPSARVVGGIQFDHTVGLWQFRADIEGQWVHNIYMRNYSRERLDDPFFMNLTMSAKHMLIERDISIEPYVMVRNLLNQDYAFVQDYPMPRLHAVGGLRVSM